MKVSMNVWTRAQQDQLNGDNTTADLKNGYH